MISETNLIESIEEVLEKINKERKSMEVDLMEIGDLVEELIHLGNELHMSDIKGRDLIGDYIHDELNNLYYNFPQLEEYVPEIKDFSPLQVIREGVFVNNDEKFDPPYAEKFIGS